MATSSSDESSTAPKDFHLSSSVDSGSRLSPNKQRCPLCFNFRKTFYCRECLQKGNFHAKSNYQESFAEKQRRFYAINAALGQVQDDCMQFLEKKREADSLSSKIKQKRERIRVYKLALEEKQQIQKRNKTVLSELRSSNVKLNKFIPRYEERVNKLGTYNASVVEKNMRTRSQMQDKREQLKRMSKIRIQQLTEFIFPITRIQPKSINVSTDSESCESDTISAIAEATYTTYIRDRWVYTDNSGELQYSIVAPTLPGSGNYSPYNIWVANNRDGVPGTSSSTTAVDHNPAYSISAALTYTAQFINMIAYYLDIRLPYKMVYSDFCSNDMNEQQFSRRVARLNANVLHLCFSQNVDPAMLQPSQTLHNILQLLDMHNDDLGRQGPLEVDPIMATSLEDQLGHDLQTCEDSDSEGGDAFPYEWEAVPHIQCPEASAGPMNLQSTQTLSTQPGQVNSLYTSAAQSIVSLWRGWTGK